MRMMKDSGIEWIGQIPEDWELTTYRRVFNRRKEYDDKDKQVLSLTIQGVKEKNESYGKMAEDFTGHQIVKKDDLVFTPRDFDATPILSGIAPCDGCISNLYFVLYPHDTTKTYVPYFNYFMWGVKWGGDIWRKLSYGMRFSYNFQQFGALPTVLPPIDMQKRIADFLDEKCGKIDHYIEKQQQVIEKLKAYKQSVITEAVTEGLNPDASMKDSGITCVGEIPSHWSVIRFKYITDAIGDGLHGTPEYDSDGEYYFLNGNNIGNENLVFKDNTDRLSESEYKKYKPVNINENTILITLNGATYGKTSFYNNEKVLLGKSAGYITLKDGENKYFVRLYLQSHIARLVMELSLCGSTRANLSLKTLNEFVMPYPPFNEQEQIVEYLNARCFEIDRAIDKKQSLIAKLTEYKKSLIFEAVTGKIEVRIDGYSH